MTWTVGTEAEEYKVIFSKQFTLFKCAEEYTIPLRKWKIASYKDQTVFSCPIKTLGIFLNVNLIPVILGLTFLPLNQVC